MIPISTLFYTSSIFFQYHFHFDCKKCNIRYSILSGLISNICSRSLESVFLRRRFRKNIAEITWLQLKRLRISLVLGQIEQSIQEWTNKNVWKTALCRPYHFKFFKGCHKLTSSILEYFFPNNDTFFYSLLTY